MDALGTSRPIFKLLGRTEVWIFLVKAFD